MLVGRTGGYQIRSRMIVAAGFVSGPAHWMLWIGAVAVLVLTPLCRKLGGFSIQPAHFVERHGLV
jgi:low temperature requirement protein LtrA